MIVTIDGYAGSGKSTAAARLAAAIDFHLLNTGAMYRAVGVLLPRHGIEIDSDVRDVERIGSLVRGWTFGMSGDAVLVNGEDVTGLTRTEAAGRAASRVGTFPEVREHLKNEQRRLAAGGDIVCEGRDQGTAVFPAAPVKFFFRASVEIRADRRVKELIDRGVPVTFSDIASQIAARDLQDESRPIDPLRQPADAIVLDTTHLSPDEVFDRMLAAVDRCRSTG